MVVNILLGIKLFQSNVCNTLQAIWVIKIGFLLDFATKIEKKKTTTKGREITIIFECFECTVTKHEEL